MIEKKFNSTIFFKEIESEDFSKIEEFTIAYEEFIDYFKNIKGNINEHQTIISISFTYSWMPTIFHFKNRKIKLVTDILNKVKKNVILNEEELNELKYCFNNSIVGTSKLLHFINPNLYPIWDSRVAKYLLKENYSYSQLIKSSIYLEYFNFCQILLKKEKNKITILKDRIEKETNSSISELRAIELSFYALSNKPQN